MTRQTASLVALVVLAAGCASVRAFLVPPDAPRSAVAARPVSTVDAIVIVGTVHGRPGARAIAVGKGQLVAVGPAADVTPLRAPETVVIRLQTAYATPGLVDAHVHLEGAAMLRDAADLRAATTSVGLLTAVAKARPLAGEWLWGFGLSPALWHSLTQDDLDAVCVDLPCYLSRSDGHGGRMSSALAQRTSAGQQARIRACEGRLQGELARDVWRSLPPVRAERLRPLVQQVLNEMAATGVVANQWFGDAVEDSPMARRSSQTSAFISVMRAF